MKQRDDSPAFTSRWLRGEKRYLLCLGFPLAAVPKVTLPPGVKWDLWYERPYLLLQLSVLSQLKKFGGLVSHKKPQPILEVLAPVRSADGKPGWYRFLGADSQLDYRVQFFPEGKSSRSEIEFKKLWGAHGITAETHGGAMTLESTPEAAYCYSRGFVLEPRGKGVTLTTLEHQNRMAWEAENLVAALPEKWWPEVVTLASPKPEFAYLAKGSPFAASFPRVIAK